MNKSWRFTLWLATWCSWGAMAASAEAETGQPQTTPSAPAAVGSYQHPPAQAPTAELDALEEEIPLHPPGHGCPPPGSLPPWCPCPYPPLPPEQRPGYHAHDGFYLRLGLGGGYATTSISAESERLTYSGNSLPFDIAIGSAVRPNLMVFGELFWGYAFAQGREPGTQTDDYLMGLQMIGVGAGVAYYFVPFNIYISGSLLFHKVAFNRMTYVYPEYAPGEEPHGATFNESPNLAVNGYATNLMVGKEWWVSGNWGLGLAAHFLLGTADNRALDDSEGVLVHARWTSIAFGLLLSATYN